MDAIEKGIKEKIEALGTPLSEWDIQINYGIKTGFNEAFIISEQKKDELIAQDPKSAEIIRPILRGRDIFRYGYKFNNIYLITTFPSKKIDISNYPAVKNHLLSFGRGRLEQSGRELNLDGRIIRARKLTNNKWFETQDSIAYWEDFYRQKIIYPNMTKYLPFYLDNNGFMTNQKCFILTGKHIHYLVSFLNSEIFKKFYRDNFPELLGGTRELSKIFFDKIPIKLIDDQINSTFRQMINNIQEKVKKSIGYKEEDQEINLLLGTIYNLTMKEMSHIWKD